VNVCTTPPSEDDIHALAEAALAALPPRLALHVKGVAILV
jgi:predicted Zn-dependent protease with MMP-like domain